MALAFKLSVLKKTHVWTPFNVQIPINDAFLFRNKAKTKYILDPPKKAQGYDTNGRYIVTRTCLCLY